MKKTTIGGQALIEGLLMIGPLTAATAIRKPDGEIITQKMPLPKRDFFSKIPIIRGVVGFFRQIVLGMKAIMYSAEFMDIGEEEEVIEEPTKADKFLDKLFGDKLQTVAIYIAVVVSLVFSIGLFIILPNVLATLMHFQKGVTYNLFEGVLRISLFFAYIVLSSKMKEIKRLWEYHGAEHKTIFCYENEEELTVENVRKYSTKHPRCGTSFLFLVMVVSIIVFSFLPIYTMIINVLLRLALVPLVAGLSYEIIKFAGRSKWKIMKVINAPGLFFQKFTTKEPDDEQIEVAIAAFKEVIPDSEEDKW